MPTGYPKSGVNTGRFKKGQNLGENSFRWKGGKPNCLTCGKKLSVRGVKLCYKHRDNSKQSLVKTGKPNLKTRGENHWNWKGGISQKRFTLEYVLWRKSVIVRDKFVCQMPGCIDGSNLEAHHIKKYSEHKELRYRKSNGITLCKKCHEKIKGKEKRYEKLFKIILLT